MSGKPTLVIGGLAQEVCRDIADRLQSASMVEVKCINELAEALQSTDIGLLILADGLEGKRAEDTHLLVKEWGGRQPNAIWCCVSATTGADSIASLAQAGADRIFFLPIDREEIVREAARYLGIEISAVLPGVEAKKTSIALSAVWARFRDSTLARIDTLESASLALLEDKLTPETQRAAEREAHKLAGSSGTFGFPRSSRIARELEQRLSSPSLTAQDAVPISELVIELRRDLEGIPEAPKESGEEATRAPGRRIFLLSPDSAFGAALEMEASGRGYKLTAETELRHAREIVVREQPALAIVALPGPDERGPMLDFVEEMESRIPSVPVIVLSSASDFRARVEVARRGAHGFLDSPLSAAKTIDAVVEAFDRMTGSRATILALDDDPQMLGAIKSLLVPLQMRVETIEDPLKIWEAMEEFSPDLVLLDIDMPYVSGFELCRALRQDTRWARLPILFLTGRDDAESVQRAFSAGADDFLRKPLVAAELLMRINSRLDRARLSRELAEVDSLTGIANRRKTAELLERFMRLARRKGDPFSLAVLDLDKLKVLNDEFGHAAGDDALRGIAQLLSRSLRAEDIVGRWGGDEFVVGLYGTNKSECAKRIRELLAIFATEKFVTDRGENFSVTSSGGVAQYPLDGSELDDLRRVADAALYQAKESGRNKVVVAGGSLAPQTRRVDVVIIDDDDALTGLLTHAFENQQLTSMAFSSGDRAVSALVGEIPEVFARVILLDVDLPAMNGLDVLRLFSRDGVTLKSKVMMLSARSGERDILTALELGAVDHIIKPFSVPVLMRKLRLALREAPL